MNDFAEKGRLMCEGSCQKPTIHHFYAEQKEEGFFTAADYAQMFRCGILSATAYAQMFRCECCGSIRKWGLTVVPLERGKQCLAS